MKRASDISQKEQQEFKNEKEKNKKLLRVQRRLMTSLNSSACDAEDGVKRKRQRTTSEKTQNTHLFIKIVNGKVERNTAIPSTSKTSDNEKESDDVEDKYEDLKRRRQGRSVQKDIPNSYYNEGDALSGSFDPAQRQRSRSLGTVDVGEEETEDDEETEVKPSKKKRRTESDLLTEGKHANNPNSRKGRSRSKSVETKRMSKKIRKALKENSETVNLNKSKSSDGETKMKKEELVVLENSFCWFCHKKDAVWGCSQCPRTFHWKCANRPPHSVCPDCSAAMVAESPQYSRLSLDQLCKLLKYALQRMKYVIGSEAFWKPVDVKEVPLYRQFVNNPMDLSLLEQNIDIQAYGSTGEFLADAKWILHNSIVFNTAKSQLTSVARAITKVCKQELLEIEKCPDCYLSAHTNPDWFIQVCKKPHLLVWARLKGFPFWPAKVLTINYKSQLVDARFFGAHDKAWVPVRDCFMLSDTPPPTGVKKRGADLEFAFDEMNDHVKEITRKFGAFVLAPDKTPFIPENSDQHLDEMVPFWKNPPIRSPQVINPRTKISLRSKIESPEDQMVRNLELMTPKTALHDAELNEDTSTCTSTDYDEDVYNPRITEHGYSVPTGGESGNSDNVLHEAPITEKYEEKEVIEMQVEKSQEESLNMANKQNIDEKTVKIAKGSEKLEETFKSPEKLVKVHLSAEKLLETFLSPEKKLEALKNPEKMVETTKIVVAPKNPEKNVEAPKILEKIVETTKSTAKIEETRKSPEKIVKIHVSPEKIVEAIKSPEEMVHVCQKTLVETTKSPEKNVKTTEKVAESQKTPLIIADTPGSLEKVAEAPKIPEKVSGLSKTPHKLVEDTKCPEKNIIKIPEKIADTPKSSEKVPEPLKPPEMGAGASETPGKIVEATKRPEKIFKNPEKVAGTSKTPEKIIEATKHTEEILKNPEKVAGISKTPEKIIEATKHTEIEIVKNPEKGAGTSETPAKIKEVKKPPEKVARTPKTLEKGGGTSDTAVKMEATKRPEKKAEILKSSEKVAEAPKSSEKVAESPKSSEKVAEAPKSSEKVAEAPKSSEKVAEAPKSSEKVAEAPKTPEKVTETTPKMDPSKRTEKTVKNPEKEARTFETSPKLAETLKTPANIVETTKNVEKVAETIKTTEREKGTSQTPVKIVITKKTPEKSVRIQKKSEKIVETTKTLEKVAETPGKISETPLTTERVAETLQSGVEVAETPENMPETPVEKVAETTRTAEKKSETPKAAKKIVDTLKTPDIVVETLKTPEIIVETFKTPKQIENVKSPEKIVRTLKTSVKTVGKPKSPYKFVSKRRGSSRIALAVSALNSIAKEPLAFNSTKPIVSYRKKTKKSKEKSGEEVNPSAEPVDTVMIETILVDDSLPIDEAAIPDLSNVEVKQENFDQYLDEENQRVSDIATAIMNLESDRQPMVTVVDVNRLCLPQNLEAVSQKQPSRKSLESNSNVQLSSEVSIVVLDSESGASQNNEPRQGKTAIKGGKSFPRMLDRPESSVTISTSTNEISAKSSPRSMNVISVNTKNTDAQKILLQSLRSDEKKQDKIVIGREMQGDVLNAVKDPNMANQPKNILLSTSAPSSSSLPTSISGPLLISQNGQAFITNSASPNITIAQNNLGQISLVQLTNLTSNIPNFVNISNDCMPNSYGPVYTSNAPPPLSPFTSASGSGNVIINPTSQTASINKPSLNGLSNGCLEIIPQPLRPGSISVKPHSSLMDPPPPSSSSSSSTNSNNQTSPDAIMLEVQRLANVISDNMKDTLRDVVLKFIKDGIPEARLKILNAEKKRMQTQHHKTITQLKAAQEEKLASLRAKLLEDKEKELKQLRTEMDKVIQETKEKQWCALCHKEALFYCCWNTSYCDYPCQQAHWNTHMGNCSQIPSTEQMEQPLPVAGKKRTLKPLTTKKGLRVNPAYSIISYSGPSAKKKR